MAHKFFGVQFRGESFYRSYQSGLSGSQCQRPQYVKELEKDALKKGRSISKKALKMLEEKNCSGEFSFISQDEQQKIISILEKESPSSKNKSIKLVHSCSRLKSHGGSAGEKRYVLFIQDNLGDLHHLELKPLVTPAPDVGAGISILKRKEIFNSQSYQKQKYQYGIFLFHCKCRFLSCRITCLLANKKCDKHSKLARLANLCFVFFFEYIIIILNFKSSNYLS
jgi:hypothetical protein